MHASPVSINHSLDNNHSRNNSYEDDDDCSCTHQDQHQLFSLENTWKGWYLSQKRQFYKMKQRLKEHSQSNLLTGVSKCVTEDVDFAGGAGLGLIPQALTVCFMSWGLNPPSHLSLGTLRYLKRQKGNRMRFACAHKGGVSLCFMKAITLLSEAHPPLHLNRAHRFYLQRLAVSHTLRC